MINTAVIPAAGLGTRLLTVTKEMPKEMIPIFSRANNEIITLPLIEKIFLQLYDAGIRNFYIVVGKNKRSIEDHFTPETFWNTRDKKDNKVKSIMEEFYKKIEKSNIIWLNQIKPKGFGAAVLTAKNVVNENRFLVHAGDAFIRGESTHITKLINMHEKYESDVTLYIREITNPKAYGVAEVKKISKNHFKILRVEEKPRYPKSDYALMPLYIFNSKIFDAISSTKPGLRHEIQLTDAIQKIIEQGGVVQSIKFERADDCIDIGTPENYFRALKISYHDSKRTSS